MHACRSTLEDPTQVAKQGDWETALTQYRLAAADHPGDKDVVERVRRAEREVAHLYVVRAAAANERGDLGQAGDLWRKALEMSPDPAVQETVRAEILSNASALEYFGDVSADFFAWEDALGAYSALLLVEPGSIELTEKFREAKREYAGDLSIASDELTRKNLKGAALVASLRALQHDPMQQGGFERVTNLRKELNARTRVALQEVTIEEKSERAKTFSLALIPLLTPKLDDYAPYGPTRDPKAIPAQFVAVVEKIERDEKVVTGEDVMANMIAPSKEPVPNPAIKEQEKVIAGLQKELADLQEQVKKAKPKGKATAIAKKATSKASATKKKKLAQIDEQKRKEVLELGRAVDKKKKEIASAKLALKELPATVPPPPPPETFTLPWKDVTRTVEARVRFELRERDFAQPIVLVVEKKMSKTDRTHKGDEKQGVFPDSLDLPTFEAMLQELAGEFADGANVIAQARTRRVDRVLAEARNKKAMGMEEAALDAYVESLFLLGAEELPEDAAIEVARSAENEKLGEILGANPAK